MSNIIQVDFRGDQLHCIQTPDGAVWVSIRRVCEVLGVNLNGQLEKLKGKQWATMQTICTAIPRAGVPIGVPAAEATR